MEAALTREVLEEIGVKIQLERLLVVCDHIVPKESQHWVAPIYLDRILHGEAHILEPDAISTGLSVAGCLRR